MRNRLKRKELNFAVCKRVRKNVKRKSLNEIRVLGAANAQAFPKWEEYPHTPGSFGKSGKCRTYGIRNLEECTENEMQESKGLGERQVDGDTR